MSDCIDLIGVVVNAVVCCGIVCLAVSSNKIANSQNSIAARDAYLSVYDLLSKALGCVSADGTVHDNAMALFWQARDRARLGLPKELEDYTQKIFDNMMEAYKLDRHKLSGKSSLPEGDERSEVVDRHEEIIEKLSGERPYKVFEKYIRIMP